MYLRYWIARISSNSAFINIQADSFVIKCVSGITDAHVASFFVVALRIVVFTAVCIYCAFVDINTITVIRLISVFTGTNI